MLGFKFSNEFQGVPTRDEWVRCTTGMFVHHRGPDLVAIDDAIGHYHQSKASHSAGQGGFKAAITKMKIVTLQLCSVIKACDEWLSNKTQSGEIGSSSRAPLVRRLAAHALDEVKVLLPEGKGFNAENPSVYLNLVASDIRWRMILPLIHNQGEGKQLHIANIMESNPGGVNPEHFLGSGIVQKFNEQTEYNFIFDFIRQAEVNVAKILYLQQDHRWEHQIFIRDGLAYRTDAKGDPTEVRATGDGNLLISAKTHRLYFLNKAVMDRDLQALNAGAAAEGKTEFRHSTFLAGEPCFFAGGMTIDAKTPGKIDSLDSCSGHYQPKPKDLIKAIKLMNETNSLDLQAIMLSVGLSSYALNSWQFVGVIICDAKEAIENPESFESKIRARQKNIYEQAVARREGGEEIEFSLDQINEAMALGVEGLDPSSAARPEPEPSPQRAGAGMPFKIKTNVKFF